MIDWKISIKKDLSHVELIYRIHYDPETGFFYRAGKREPIGNFDSDGYVKIRAGDRSYGAHRLAWFYMNGAWPHHQIDHINRVKYDNRISNLRDVPK